MNLTRLEDRLMPDAYMAVPFAVGADAGGGPHVKMYYPDNSVRLSFFAFDPQFQGGVRVATGDVSGDGVPDLIAAAGPGGGPHIRVFDGQTGAQLTFGPIGSFFAYDKNFSGGVYVAAADVDGDRYADVITGAGAGGGPHVRVFSGKTGALIHEFFAYAPGFSGGVRVAVADVTGADLVPEIITGAGPGGGSHVRVFNSATLAPVYDFMAFDPSYVGGVFVTGTDLNNDFYSDIVVGQGQGQHAHLRTFSGATSGLMGDIEPFAGGGGDSSSGSYPDGIRVVALDRTVGFGQVEIMVGSGRGIASVVQAWKGSDLSFVNSFAPYDPTFPGGVFVG